jgi:hypothetical protein
MYFRLHPNQRRGSLIHLSCEQITSLYWAAANYRQIATPSNIRALCCRDHHFLVHAALIHHTIVVTGEDVSLITVLASPHR